MYILYLPGIPADPLEPLMPSEFTKNDNIENGTIFKNK